MSNKKLTIVITTYNLERYISKVLDTLVNQTCDDFKIIVVDDISTDKTIRILYNYKNMFKDRMLIIPLKEKMYYASKVRNYVLDNKLIDTEYVTFIDGDDTLELNYVEVMLNNIEYNDIIICGYRRLDINNKLLCTEMNRKEIILNMPKDIMETSIINGAVWNKVFKYDVIKDVRFSSIKIGEDLLFQQKIYTNTVKIKCIRNVLVNYLDKENSAMNTLNLNDLKAFYYELESLYNNNSEHFSLLMFIHIGISMPVRIYANKNENINEAIKWVRIKFRDKYFFFKGINSVKLLSLSKMGIKGLALWGCLILYKINCFKIFLVLYSFVTKTLKIDIKF